MDVRKDALIALVRAELEGALDKRELRRRGREALVELAGAAAELAELRPPGEVRLRIANPGGARAGRTTVEILAADQPFIVDTVRLALRRLERRELLLLHPLLALEREADGTLARIGKDAVGRTRESYVYVELPALETDTERAFLASELERALGDARRVVADHGAMLDRLREHVACIEASAAALSGGTERARKLGEVLRWLESDGFVFMGYRRYATRGADPAWTVELDPASALGLLRDSADSRFREGGALAPVPALVRARLGDPRVIFFDKTRFDSTVHRRGRLDSVSLKLLDREARVVGFGRFVGLFTNRAMRMRPSALSVLATRRASVLEGLGVEPGSHSWKLALEAFDSLPVEFLLPTANPDATRVVAAIVAAAEGERIEVATVADSENRSFFVTVALPRRLYEERMRVAIEALLAERHGAAQIDQRSSFLDEDLALLHFFCASQGELDPAALGKLEGEIRARVERWQDRFEAALLERRPAQRAFGLGDAYADAFPESYRVVTAPAEAVLDVDHLERLGAADAGVELGLDFATAYGDARTHRLKLYLRERPYLTDLLPVVQKFGVRVVDATQTEVRAGGRAPRWIVSFRIEPLAPDGGASGEAEARVLDGLRAALSGRVDSDDLNRLVLRAELDWRSVDVLRAYLAYARQIGQAPADALAGEALLRHRAATRSLVALFRARLDPDTAEPRSAAVSAATDALERARAPIASAAEDRVFAVLESLIQATLRTSFFAPAPSSAPHELALKLDSKHVRGLPAPVPATEIFVHSPELVGVHLRGGPVARGGIRWSDRPDDLRTEILSLWKTQRVKNGLIVPLGAKGGFALRRASVDAQQARAEADRLYARFVAALLGLVDDVRGERVVSAGRIVRHDGDDPYLVVAADKGTAHLSDVANAVAEARGFWLGDAFASGGSHGYDHKREAITARGAWLCARAHFCALGRDPEREPFRVAGIGDMSGDVFGNGLLLMPNALLVAAFDHRHVFLDPDPDPGRAHAERTRLFALPRSSWADYAGEAISRGGGVWERGAKRIALSPEARRALDCAEETLSGEELIRAILRMPVDLLWNGGIGTYVKASGERHAAAGDRANDAVRIDARELRAAIVAEGGNLGLTQLARVEYALAGGRIDSDAIHNSGGVDLSDHEVNFKILLASARGERALANETRHALLRECVDDAARAVLAHNAAHVRCLSLDLLRARSAPARISEAQDFLARSADLEPALEGLPTPDALRARASAARASGDVWTRPELAILLGYTKLCAKRALARSSVPDHPALAPLLASYFPARLARELAPELATHRLRREITALELANHVIDQAGVTLLPELSRALAAPPADVLAAWWSADALLDGAELRARLETATLGEHERSTALLGVEAAVREVAALCLGLEGRALYSPDELARRRDLTAELAASVDGPGECSRAFGAVLVALRSDAPLARALALWRELGTETRTLWLLDRLDALPPTDAWSRSAAQSLALDLVRSLSALCERAVSGNPASVAALRRDLAARLGDLPALVAEIDAGERTLAPLVALSQRIRSLC